MSDTMRTVISREVGAGVFVSYEVELTNDARALVSSRLKSVEVHYSEGRLVLTPKEARQMAVTILGALDTVDPQAVVNR